MKLVVVVAFCLLLTETGQTQWVSNRFAQSKLRVLVQQDLAIPIVKRIKPSQAFHFAYQNYLEGHYGLALSAFQQFIVDFPDSSVIPQAYYYLGECYEQQGNVEEVKRVLEIIIEVHRKSRQVPAALFKLGTLMEKEGNSYKAKEYWDKLIKDYRGSPEAKLASSQIKRIP
jgi:tol-pal system protein YbgF